MPYFSKGTKNTYGNFEDKFLDTFLLHFNTWLCSPFVARSSVLKSLAEPSFFVEN